MSTYASNPQQGPCPALVKMFRYFKEASDRRLLRDLQKRAEWIDEARNAPTVQDLADGLSRRRD